MTMLSSDIMSQAERRQWDELEQQYGPDYGGIQYTSTAEALPVDAPQPEYPAYTEPATETYSYAEAAPAYAPEAYSPTITPEYVPPTIYDLPELGGTYQSVGTPYAASPELIGGGYDTPVDPSMYAQFGFGSTGEGGLTDEQAAAAMFGDQSGDFFRNPQYAESDAQFDYTTNPANRGGVGILAGLGNALAPAIQPIGPLADAAEFMKDAVVQNRSLANQVSTGGITAPVSGGNYYAADPGMVSVAGDIVLPQTPLDLAAMGIPAAVALGRGQGLYGALAEAIAFGPGQELGALPDAAKLRSVLEVPQYADEAAQLAGQAGQTVIPKAWNAASAETAPFGTRIAGAGVDETAPVAQRLLGIEVPEPALTLEDKALNAVKRTVGYGIESDEAATPIMRERARALGVADNEANRLSSVAIDEAKAFNTDKAGRIIDLPGSPTIQDVAARLPEYEELLTPAQRTVLTGLRDRLEPYRQALLEQGVDVRTRGDIIDGGFYLPRGRADIEGLDEPNRYISGMSRGGKKGFEKTATFESMAQGLDAGYSYAPFGEAIRSYVRDAGGRIVDKFTANSLLGLTDESGNILAETAADRINPALRDEVTKLRSQISTRLQTITRQTSRGNAQRVEERRINNLLRDIEIRVDKAANKVDGLPPTEAALQRAREELRLLEQQTRRLARAEIPAATAVGKSNAISEMQTLLEREQRAAQKAVDAAVERLDNTRAANRLGLGEATPTERLTKQVRRLQARVDGLNSFIAKVGGDRAAATSRAQKLLDDVAALGDKPGRSDFAAVSQEIRQLERQTVRNAVADAELKTLDRTANRVAATAQASNEAARKTALRRQETLDAVAEMRAKLDDISAEWQRAQRQAMETPRGQGRVQMAGLQSYTFPEAMAEAINKELRIGVQRGPIEEVIKAVNNLLRPVSATADLSFMGIQGLIGAVDKPLAYGKALTTAIKSLKDENAVGAFIRAFDEKAVKAGLPTSADWVRSGLKIGGTDTEFTVGRGLGGIGDRIQGLPVVKQTNRGFGTFGDSLRLAMADAHYSGKGAGADMQGIAAAVNRATGAGKGRFAGDVGDLVTFAPRYFNSQLEMITKAASPSMGAESMIARKQLGSLIGLGVLATAGANEALGNKFDYLSPTVDGHPNSNFMRIRIDGEDVSLFAGWDSLFRAVAYASQGDFGYLARTKASPVVSHAWDILAGENFIGDPVNFQSKEGVTNFMRSFLPFSTQKLGQESPVGTGLNAIGVKSSPLSLNDQLFERAEQTYKKDYKNLDPEEQAAVNASLANEGTSIPAYKRRMPYEDGARQTAFEIFRDEKYPPAQEFNTLDEFRADYIKVKIEEGQYPEEAARNFTKLLNSYGFDDQVKNIRFAIVRNDPDIVDSLTNPSKEIRDYAEQIKAGNAK